MDGECKLANLSILDCKVYKQCWYCLESHVDKRGKAVHQRGSPAEQRLVLNQQPKLMTLEDDILNTYRERQMRWKSHLHDQPHTVPPDGPIAGAQWSPDVEAYDRNRPMYPRHFSEEEKQAQEAAGSQLKEDIERTIRDGGKDFEIPPGHYRLKEPIVIEGTEDFTLFGRDVELVVSVNCSHFRILSNKNLKVFGPMTLDAQPFATTQGDIVALDKDKKTIDVRIWDEYDVPTKGMRIEIFNDEGIMLPHCQDGVQSIEDLGNRVVRLQMNDFTWTQHTPETIDEILKIGNMLALELDGRGGMEMRSNTNTLWEDITQCSHALAWALPEYGDDIFVRWKGSRRRGTNRLAAGGYPLMTFYGGSYTLIDSEIGHNFDDLTDINTAQSFAFHQLAPNQFLACEGFIFPESKLTLCDYRTMEIISECTVLKAADADDQEGTKKEFTEIANKLNVRDLGSKILVVTVDQDIRTHLHEFGVRASTGITWNVLSITSAGLNFFKVLLCSDFPELAYVSPESAICREMRFERNYIHDGLSAGINGKGAYSVIIKDNIVERAAGFGIAVSLDPFWWEGNPSRNIEITGNTVRNCSYITLSGQPGITVYTGGSYDGMPGPDGTGQLQEDMIIANNAVFTSAGPGIIVSNAKNIEIRDNVITDCNFSRKTQGSIFLNAVSEGTRVTGNVFVGYDASEQNVQIKTGEKTDPRTIILERNRCANPEVPVPSLPWHFWPMTDRSVEFHDREWHDCDGYPKQHKESFEEGALCVFRFEGSKVRILGGSSPWHGLADIWIDDQFQTTADTSRPIDFCLAPFFMSPVLTEGEHWVKIRNKAEPGKYTTDERKGLSIFGFDVLPNGSGICL